MQVLVFQRLGMCVNIDERVDSNRSNMEYFIPSDKSVTLPQRRTKPFWPSQICKILLMTLLSEAPAHPPSPPPPPIKKHTFPK